MANPEILSAGKAESATASEAADTWSSGVTFELIAPEALERIEHLKNLASDWDGHGGLPVNNAAAQSATQLLLKIHVLTMGNLNLPFIAPLPDGGLILEWIQDSGKELTLEVSADGNRVEYLLGSYI